MWSVLCFGAAFHFCGTQPVCTCAENARLAAAGRTSTQAYQAPNAPGAMNGGGACSAPAARGAPHPPPCSKNPLPPRPNPTPAAAPPPRPAPAWAPRGAGGGAWPRPPPPPCSAGPAAGPSSASASRRKSARERDAPPPAGRKVAASLKCLRQTREVCAAQQGLGARPRSAGTTLE